MRKNRRKSCWCPARNRGRYKKLLRHKHLLKKSHAREWQCSSWNSLILESEKPEHIYRTVSPLDYWKHYYKRSTEKRYAKRTTNRAIRSKFRDTIRAADYEEFPKSLSGSEYQRYFDYAWWIF